MLYGPDGLVLERSGDTVVAPNGQAAVVDIHGQAHQPASDPDMPYKPQPEPDMADEAVARSVAAKKMARFLRRPFRQREVDEVRWRVLINWARTVIHMRWGNVPVMHLWFSKPGDIDDYELRSGNPPADADRPKHLRGLRLEVDATYIPQRVRDYLRPGGGLEQAVQAKMDESEEDLPSGLVLMETINRFAAQMAWGGGERDHG